MSDGVVFSVSPVTIDVECTLCTKTINVSLDSQSTYYTEQKKDKHYWMLPMLLLYVTNRTMCSLL